MKIGVSVSIYCYDEDSYKSTIKTIESLIANSSVLVKKIVLVDDCSPYKEIFEYYKTLRGVPKLEIVRNKINLGIGQVKNIGIKKLNTYDLIALSDNDVEYKKGWDTFLLHSMYAADIKMVSLSDLWGDSPPQKKETINKVNLHYNARLNGCFIAFWKEVVDNIGGYPNLPEKYGQEHCNYQLRCAKYYGHYPYCIDVVGLKDFLIFKDCPSHLSYEEKVTSSNRNAHHSNAILSRSSMFNDDYLEM